MKEQYNPRPVFQLITNSLEEAIAEQDWSIVENVILQIKQELERTK